MHMHDMSSIVTSLVQLKAWHDAIHMYNKDPVISLQAAPHLLCPAPIATVTIINTLQQSQLLQLCKRQQKEHPTLAKIPTIETKRQLLESCQLTYSPQIPR